MMESSADSLKIVAHLADGTLIKGFADDLAQSYAESLARRLPEPPPETIPVRLYDSGDRVEVCRDALKALFFVKSFEGSDKYTEVKFFKAHPLIEGLWVRLKFSDQENTEGVVYNSAHFVVNPGFFLKPPDPHSNNEMVYVLKSSLIDFRVLGVRGSY